jgi:uncharacterized protein (TIGR02284 family)
MASRNDVLKNLLELNNDRVDGFEKVLNDIEDPNIDLKTLFMEYAAQSRKFSQELQPLVANLDVNDEDDNSFAGTLHRVWIDVKALFGNNDRESILNEAERGEDAIKAAYEKALESGVLIGATHSLVQEQYTAIKAAHDRIRSLRDIASQMPS